MTLLPFKDDAASRESAAPLIFEIKGNSLDDGPGIRTVVFFKGCPLSCVWCHNPEGKAAGQEIAFDARVCIACDTCLGVCGPKALSRENPCFIDRKRCTLCFQCVEACPSGALSRVGNDLSVADVMRKILPDKPFFVNSGGGVTLSGGEPTLFMDYTSELLKALKAAGIHTLLETCGLFPFHAFERKLLPWLDAVYYDLKIYDWDDHIRYCGVSNEKIVKNFERLVDAAAGSDLTLLPRIPLIPDMTDTEANLRAMAGFLKSLDVHRIAVLSYNPLWFEKCAKIGADAPFRTDPAKKTWMSSERVNRVKEIFEEYGIDAV
jgi:pyruvate formate lyase activating enzyme